MPTKGRVAKKAGNAGRNFALSLLAIILAALIVVLFLRASFTESTVSDAAEGSAPVATPVSIAFEFDDREGAVTSPVSLHIETLHDEEEGYSEDLLLDPGKSDTIWLMAGSYRMTNNTSPVLSDGAIFVDSIDQEFPVMPNDASTEMGRNDNAAVQTVVLSFHEEKGLDALSAEELEAFKKDFNSFGIDESYLDFTEKNEGESEVPVLTDAKGAEASDRTNSSDPGDSLLSDLIGSYVKEWPVEGAEYNPSYSVFVESVEGRTVRFSVSYVATNLRYIVGTNAPGYGMLSAQLDEDGVMRFAYEEDGRGGKGVGTIEFHDGYLVINVSSTYVEKGEEGKTLETDEPLLLRKVSSDSSGALHVG